MQSKTRAARSQGRTSSLREEDAVQRASHWTTDQGAMQTIETAKGENRKQEETREVACQRDERSARALDLARI